VAAADAAAAFAWIEGEAPREQTLEPDTHGWGAPELLSGEAWLTLNKSHAKEMPEAGARFAYDFALSEEGAHEIWARLGYYQVWYPFEWRIDDGDWQTVAHDHTPTVGFTPIEPWHKLVWTRFAVQDLAAGDHRIEFRLPHPDTLKGKGPRFLFALDAICIHRGTFRPNDAHRPGADWRSERDLEAERQVFPLPEAGTAGARVDVELDGLWQFARWDEPGAIEQRLGPIPDPPPAEELFWSHIKVPGDRNALRPDMQDAHRFFYRTRVHVPESHRGRSFVLDFPMNAMISTVFVNGQRVGFSKAPFAAFRCDATNAIEVGAENEIWVGIKDVYYGISPELTDGGTVREFWAAPMRKKGSVTRKLDMPMALMAHAGMIDRPRLLSVGGVYADEVYVTTSVAEDEIAAELVLRNPGTEPARVSVSNEVVDWRGDGEVVHALPERALALPAGGAELLELSAAWADPQLWWPDDPHLYELVTTVRVDGAVVDVERSRFGFREWGIEGTRFTLNGVVWKLWQTGHPHGNTPDERLAVLRNTHQDMLRRNIGMNEPTRTFAGLNLREFFDYADEHGIIVRPNGPFEGMFASYHFTDALWDNAAHTIAQVFKGHRDHPSIGFWAMQNEIVLINLRDAELGGPRMDRIADAIREYDDTRPIMNDGAGATGDLKVTGFHYPVVTNLARHFPDEAYTWEVSLDRPYGNVHGKRAVLDMSKPVFLGEAYYTGGTSLGTFASIGGPECFRGIAHCEEARQKMGQILTEGYRWKGIAGAALGTDLGYHSDSFAPVALFCREWDWTHAAGAEVPRTLKVFNMTRHADPVTARWQLTIDGALADSGERVFELAPGTTEEFTITLAMPALAEGIARSEGELALVCEQGGEEVFRATKAVSVIDPDAGGIAAAEAGDVVVYDDSGLVAARLDARGVPYATVAAAAEIPVGTRVVIVGPDTLDEAESRSDVWHELAAGGARVLVLDQRHPLAGEAVDADLGLTDFTGRIAFIENPRHPAFEGLKDSDFFTRARDHVVYRRAYQKASRGARSLLQCDQDLTYTALAELQVGDGLLLLCQAAVGSKLDYDPVFQRLFDNLLDHALSYDRVVRSVAVAVPGDGRKAAMLDAIDLAYQPVADPLAAMGEGGAEIVIVDASPANLARLREAQVAVDTFVQGGGWVVLWGVTPEGLADFNALVGVDHLMRPLRQERVSLRRPLDPLAVGMAERDVAMTSGKKYTRFSNTEIPSSTAFSHVVDYTDVAPFCEYPGPEYFKHFDEDPLNSGHHPLNMVNGMTSTDHWRFLFYFHLDDDAPTTWSVELPRRERIEAFEIIANAGYRNISEFRLAFDDRAEDALSFEIKDLHGPVVQRFDFESRAAEIVEMTIADWERSGGKNVVGIDNIALHAERSDAFYERVHPLLTVGVLNRYAVGEGGFVLNQIALPESERNPDNTVKKRSLLKSLLVNLHAAFGDEQMTASASDLVGYRPIVFGGDQVNLFLTREQGWPDPERDLGKLPLGDTRLGRVPYTIFENPLAPGEANLAGLGSRGDFEGATGIEVPVSGKADGLFFLHGFLHEQGVENASDDPPVVLRYVIGYADGSEAVFPIHLGEEIGSWLSTEPADLSAAKLAWRAESTQGQHTVLYQTFWNNPHPGRVIETIELRITEAGERLGMAVVAAITAGER
jgi:beta-galactosidase